MFYHQDDFVDVSIVKTLPYAVVLMMDDSQLYVLVDEWQKPQYGEMFEGHQLFVGFADQA